MAVFLVKVDTFFVCKQLVQLIILDCSFFIEVQFEIALSIPPF